MGLADFVDRTVTHVRNTPVDAAELPPGGVQGSLFSGAAGVAFFLLEMGRLRADPSLLPVARRWWALANAWAARATPDDWYGLPDGFLAGEAGVAHVDALLSAAEGDARRVLAAVERVDHVTARGATGAQFRPGELVGGMAGVACLTRDLAARLHAPSGSIATSTLLARVEARAVASLETDTTPAAEAQTLGMAHGVAGELWVLLRAHGAGGVDMRRRLAELAALRRHDDEGLVHWARTPDEIDQVCAWCAGLAGQSVLWTDVARRSGNDDDASLARSIATSLAALPERTPGICCGLAGQALAFQRFADLTGDARFTRIAYDRLARAAAIVDTHRDLRLGLWQGALGVALVAEQRLRGIARFPLLEPPAPDEAIGSRGRASRRRAASA